MKKILGLDLGTNSIGWALVSTDESGKPSKIDGLGSRIIPMTQDELSDFDKGTTISKTAERRVYRSARRLRQRFLLRRDRLHRVLNVLGFLPQHYADQIDFTIKFGQFREETEPKLAYKNSEFLFKDSFDEMLSDFRKSQPELLNRKNRHGEDAKIPYDWTIYYLRKKALSNIISKEALAWIILNFNQKRGYYQLREEELESPENIKEYIELLRVVKVEKGEKDKKNDSRNWYSITLENGWIYSATFTAEPNWLNSEKEFLITEELDENGNIKIVKNSKNDLIGREKRKITPLPSFEEIDLMNKSEQDKIYKKIKARTEHSLANSGKTVGTYIYDALLNKPNQKIRGKLIRTIERKYYKAELELILKKQIELQPDLFSVELLNDCIRELYRNNEARQMILGKRDFVHLFVEDIIFYQRPLRSQKHLIGNCPLEYRKYKDSEGKEIKEYLKVIPKSHPLYQEFRVWKWMYDLRILTKDEEKDVTSIFIKDASDYERLFEFLMSKKEVNHVDVIKHLLEPFDYKPKELKTEVQKYRWNYVYDSINDESKKYPCNETGFEISNRLNKVINVPDGFLTPERIMALWHIVYSVIDKESFEKAIGKFARKYGLNEQSFIEEFKKFPPYKSEYGSYSEKAIKRILALMRIGKYWRWESIDSKTSDRIDKIITGEYDESIKDRVRTKAISLTETNHFQGLQDWLAKYIVYDRHSESGIEEIWTSCEEIDSFLNDFKQFSLRNPIVEKIITETLRVVRDIWKKFGNDGEKFLDEVHIELGREMKNTVEDRKKITNRVSENENTNLRVKALLLELKANSDGQLLVERVRPYSPIQQEALRIFEDGVLNSDVEIPDDILKISKLAQPSTTELIRYKLWLEQKYRSPYTGEIIPLSKLFTEKYQIEHIIPQSRYFDDGLSNKVICEAAVNQLKDNQLGLEFVKNHGSEIIETEDGKKVKILDEAAYKDFVNQHYSKNRSKKINLLLDEIPDKMIARQLNDTRHISKYISKLLSNLVRQDNQDDGENSKNVIPVNGAITARLKQDWGLESVWNDIVLSRFERMNELTKSNQFTVWNEKYQKYIPQVPYEFSKGFSKKRIDHRHHAMDALVIACATRDHVNLLNNEHAKSDKSRFDLNRKLRNFEKVIYKHPETGARIERDIPREFLKPWGSFTKDAKDSLERIVVSFKQNSRIVGTATNRYEKIVVKNGEKVKEIVSQENGDRRSVRQPLHKATYAGKVELKWLKGSGGKTVTASRKSIDKSFTLKKIESITDKGIQEILRNYLQAKGGDPEIAFSSEGIDEMNKNIILYNNGKFHHPIKKARIFEVGSKFQVGQKGNKKSKYVEAEKGTNLFFAIYQDKNHVRSYETIPLNLVVERIKQGLSPVPEINDNGISLLFYLSPNDLVYVPSEDYLSSNENFDVEFVAKNQTVNIYKMVSSSGSQCFFVRQTVANSIIDKSEFSPLNKMERSVCGKMIKSVCFKLEVDRLGNISLAKH